jgi:hypothetical protein
LCASAGRELGGGNLKSSAAALSVESAEKIDIKATNFIKYPILNCPSDQRKGRLTWLFNKVKNPDFGKGDAEPILRNDGYRGATGNSLGGL